MNFVAFHFWEIQALVHRQFVSIIQKLSSAMDLKLEKVKQLWIDSLKTEQDSSSPLIW